MSLRTLLTAALALACALAARPALAGSGPKDDGLVRVVYPVADLVVPVPDADGEKRAPAATLESRLIALICKTVRPASWAESGGAGGVEYFPLGMALVVRQSPEVQDEIADLLRALRRLQDVEVCVEMRIVQLAPDRAADFRTRAGFAKAKTAEGKVVETAFVTEAELAAWFKRFQADPATNLTQAPKITMFPGQNACIRAETRQSYVTEYRVVHNEGGVEVVPRHKPVDVGLRCRLQPTVSADRRFVQLKLDFRQTSETGPAAVFPVQIKYDRDGAERTFTGFVQQPRVQTLAVKHACTIADGRTMVVPLGQVVVEARQETGVPVLGQVPYLGRLFGNSGVGREARSVFLFVTPRVIVNEEEEVPASSLVPRQ